MRCPYCGAEVSIAQNPVCEYCDSDLSSLAQPDPAPTREMPQQFPQINTSYRQANSQFKSKQTALILCCIGLLGFGGLHRFYVGKIGTGLLHFFTYGCFWIGTIIDLVLIATDNFTDSNGNKLV